jgi:hypothetical protein
LSALLALRGVAAASALGTTQRTVPGKPFDRITASSDTTIEYPLHPSRRADQHHDEPLQLRMGTVRCRHLWQVLDTTRYDPAIGTVDGWASDRVSRPASDLTPATGGRVRSGHAVAVRIWAAPVSRPRARTPDNRDPAGAVPRPRQPSFVGLRVWAWIDHAHRIPTAVLARGPRARKRSEPRPRHGSDGVSAPASVTAPADSLGRPTTVDSVVCPPIRSMAA